MKGKNNIEKVGHLKYLFVGLVCLPEVACHLEAVVADPGLRDRGLGSGLAVVSDGRYHGYPDRVRVQFLRAVLRSPGDNLKELNLACRQPLQGRNHRRLAHPSRRLFDLD